MITTLSAVTGLAIAFSPLTAPVPASVCAAHLDSGALRPAWCGKAPPSKSYEKFRTALVQYQTSVTGIAGTIADGIGDLGPIGAQCRDNPPVNGPTVDLIISGMYLLGNPDLDRMRVALQKMRAVTDSVFAGESSLPEVKAVLTGLDAKVDEYVGIITALDVAGDRYSMGDCAEAEAIRIQAADDMVAIGQFNTRTLVNLSLMLGATNKPCKSATVKDPFSKKVLKKSSGSTSVKSVQFGDMSVDYPRTVDIGGSTWLPLNIESTAPSGYVQVVLTEGSKSLAALGGGTPAGASGVRLKVVGKVKPGPAKLRISFSPVGASDVSRTVTIRFR